MNKLLLSGCLAALTTSVVASVEKCDLVIYGSSPAAFSAAVQAIAADIAVQDLPYEPLKAQLLADGQVLSWP